MIITGSENGDSKVSPTIPNEGSTAEAQSPPPYSPSTTFSNIGDTKPLPTPPRSPPSSSYDDSTTPLLADLPPPSNHLLQRRSNDSIKGVWHIDTAMSIPDSLLAPLEDFDGVWNEVNQKCRKKDKKGKRPSRDSPALGMSEVRPNLMLQSKNGSINATVHVTSSDGTPRPALIVSEGHNGSVTLEVRTYTNESIRVHAISQNGTVRVRIPQTFEGAVIAHTKNGSIKISDSIKTRMTTFSASDTMRGYIGDWQAAGFGTNPEPPSSDPNADPPLPSLADPFSTWAGSLVQISSHNGTVHLSFTDEQPEANGNEQGGWREFVTSLFGNPGRQARGPPGTYGSAPWGDSKFPWGNGAPWGEGPGPHPTPTPGMPFGPFGRGAFGVCAPGSGPFGRGGPCGRGPFARGGGSWGPGRGGWGCGSSRADARQTSWGGGRVGEREPSDDKDDERGFPGDWKERPSM